MQPATHKKIVFAALGCGGLLVVLIVVSFLFVGKAGFDAPETQMPVAPLQAAVALDSLSDYDLAALLAPRGPDNLLPAASSVAAPVARWSGERHVILAFGDTFPPDSWQGESWRDDGSAVVIDSLRAGGTRPPADSQPTGHALLAAARVALDSADLVRAREEVGLAIRRARELQGRSDLLAVIAGLRLERDAARMIGADSLLAGTAGARGRAEATVVALDRRLRELRQVRALIAAAGASPAAIPALAELVRDSTQPLAARDEIVHSIAYGWLLDPPEMSFGLDSARIAAMQRLAEADLPPELQRTVRALTLGRPGMVRRFNLSLSYRTRRIESLDF